VDILNYTQPSPPYPENTKCRFDPNFIGYIQFSQRTDSPLPPPNVTQRICPDKDINYLDADTIDNYPLPDATHYINMTISFQLLTDIQLAYFNNITFDGMTIGTQYGMPEHYAFVQQSRSGSASMIAKNASGDGPYLYSDSTLRWYIPDNAVVDVFIANTDGGCHPIHLHGHRFAIVSSSNCPEAESKFAGNYLNRDVVSVPGAIDDDTPGWAKFRFIANNPGVWMIHCHIDWHQEAGLVAVFMESPYAVQMSEPPPDQVAFCNPATDDSSSDDLSWLNIGLIVGCAILLVLLLGTCAWMAFGPRRSGFSKQDDSNVNN